MDKLTKEQAEVVRVAVNKIACAVTVMSILESTDYRVQKYIDIKNEAVLSLQQLGVEIGE